MAKTIEERAEDYSEKFYGMCSAYFGVSELEDAYKKGATEQKEIDDAQWRKDMEYVNVKKQELIEKACEEFCICMGCGQYPSCSKSKDWCIPRENFERKMKD